MVILAALLTVVLLNVYPPVAPLAMVSTVCLFVWRRRVEIIRSERARTRAKAEERRRRELMAALRSLG